MIAKTHRRVFIFRAIFLVAFVTAGGQTAIADTLPPLAPSADAAFFGARIQRTMTLLETSSDVRRNPVKILFYGQSITAQSWWKTIVDDLRTRFPFADIAAENRSIGGFTAPALVKTAVHDLYPAYPDLVVFHVYGGERTGELERIFSNIRRYTTAEILTYTHHVAWPRKGTPETIAKRQQGDDRSASMTRYLAQKYNCELVEVRKEWKRYLKDNGMAAKDFLSDGIHLNDKGKGLMAALVGRHFSFNPRQPNRWMNRVRTYEVKRAVAEGMSDEIVFVGEPWKKWGSADAAGSSPQGVLKLDFVGNRVDVVGGNSYNKKLGSATILLDGKPPSADPGVYHHTRASKALGAWWPAVSRIGHRSKLIAEDWTLRITKISPDAREFSFEVEGSVTGRDGAGDNKELFVSKSGRVVIKPKSFGIRWAQTMKKKKCPVGFEVKWKTVGVFVNTYKAPQVIDRSRVYRTTLFQGIENGPHTLKIIPNGDGIVPLRDIQVHRPPLR